VTHGVLSTRPRLDRIAAIGNRTGKAVDAMLSFSQRFDLGKYGEPGAPLHDPCVIAWLLQPDLFEGREINVTVETHSELTMGLTVADWWRITDRPRNVFYLRRADANGFYALSPHASPACLTVTRETEAHHSHRPGPGRGRRHPRHSRPPDDFDVLGVAPAPAHRARHTEKNARKILELAGATTSRSCRLCAADAPAAGHCRACPWADRPRRADLPDRKCRCRSSTASTGSSRR
jgi:hypothetical protein